MNTTAKYDCESYCHFSTHSDAVGLEEMFVIDFFKDQSPEFSQVCCRDRLFLTDNTFRNKNFINVLKSLAYHVL